MAYTILRFKKDKGGAVAGCERHNERKKEAYKSNPDIDINKSKDNYHIIQAPKYTYCSKVKPNASRISGYDQCGITMRSKRPIRLSAKP